MTAFDTCLEREVVLSIKLSDTDMEKSALALCLHNKNNAGPVPLVLDLRLTHDRFGSSSDPSLNGRLHYPND